MSIKRALGNFMAIWAFTCLLMQAAPINAADFADAKQRYQESLPNKARYEFCIKFLQENPDSSINPARARDAARINELTEKSLEQAASCSNISAEELSALKSNYEREYKQSQEYEIIESVFYKSAQVSAQQKMRVEENCSLFFDSAFEARPEVEKNFSLTESECDKKPAIETSMNTASVEVTSNSDEKIAPETKEKSQSLREFIDATIPESAAAPILIALLFAIIFAIYVFIAALMKIRRTAYEKYDLKMIKSFQFFILLCGFISFVAAFLAEDTSSSLAVGTVSFIIPFSIALLMNIRKSNLKFGLTYTIAQAIMSILFIMIVGFIIALLSKVTQKISKPIING